MTSANAGVIRLATIPSRTSKGAIPGALTLCVMKEPPLKRDGPEAGVNRIGGAAVASVTLAIEAERTDGLIAVDQFEVPEGSLHDEPSKVSNQTFQPSLELVGAGGCDL